MSTIKKTLGGDRLGAGRKMTQEMHGFGRSSHDVGMVFRTDQAIGTIVPAFCQLGTTGTTFYLDIKAKTRTLPTNGPIFGTLKHQIDVFMIPIRLYVGALHNNMLGIGLSMQDVKLPQYTLQTKAINKNSPTNVNWQQISQDSLIAYLGTRAVGNHPQVGTIIKRKFNGLFLLAYWDIYKNYYANKQEGVGYAIGGAASNILSVLVQTADGLTAGALNQATKQWTKTLTLATTTGPTGNYLRISTDQETLEDAWNKTREQLKLYQTNTGSNTIVWENEKWELEWLGLGTFTAKLKKGDYTTGIFTVEKKDAFSTTRGGIKLNKFDLVNIDEARMIILSKAAEYNTPVNINSDINSAPYNYSVGTAQNDNKKENHQNDSYVGNASWYNQAGLGLRTYLSDRFNNWLSTEWIDGTNGINEVTAIQIVDNKLTMDALILQKKIFDMMNRIAISGGSYNDWQEAVYGVQVARMAESPIYMGGASYEIVFDEVVSNSATENEPLGSLAGRGTETNQRGGRGLRIKCEEPSLIIALESYVPRVDYSQGNKWWNRLETMNDLHKPNLDAIGFQELITDEFAALDTIVSSEGNTTYHSVGKQVSWQEYMTNVNETFGDFAVGGSLDWMAFNRKYEYDESTNLVSDATTYIDPAIFNVAFANAKLSAKNLWTQIAFDVTARRVMSAKQIPNL